MTDPSATASGGAAADEPAAIDESATEPTPQRGHARLWALLFIIAAVVGGGGALAWSQVRAATSSPYDDVSFEVPTASRLVAGSGETVFRIDPTQSKASYGVDEKIIGTSAHHATGSTNGIAGDIAINPNDPSASRIGQIVINVEQFHSDNKLRDARIRNDFLESHDHPLAQFKTTKLLDLPAKLSDGQWYSFRMVGDLTVKGATKSVTWQVRGEFRGDTLSATATTRLKMSEFGVGPISIAGLVKTDDNVDLTLQLTALDPSKKTVPNVIARPSAANNHKGGPSFKTQIRPILEQSCASCHNTGQVGASAWQLQTSGDAAAIADGIRVITKNRYMPPWPASDKSVKLAHNPSLSQKTIDLLAEWAAAGGQLDEPEATPITPAGESATLQPRKDLALQMPKSYTGIKSIPNDYRCFVLDPKITEPTFVTGYTFGPDQIAEIHHSQIFKINSEQMKNAASFEGRDGRTGWQCFGSPNLPGRTREMGRRQVGQDNLIGGWAPGQTPAIYPQHSGILFQPGDALVLQIHYHYEGTPTPDRSSLWLQTEPGTANVKQMEIENPLGPVEIPCNPGVTARLCDRDAAMADNVRLYGPSALYTEPGLLGLCGRTKEELQATFKDGIASSWCNSRVPEDGQIVSVTGHMHTLGKSIRMTLDPDQATQKILLDIPVWNFDWQMSYALETPIHVQRGQTIRLDCSWDRSLDPNRQPKYIVFADGTEDEMCFSTYAFIPDKQN